METEPQLPVPISLVGGKYLVFDVNIVSWLRRKHHICGVMSGTLPQVPSQNVFLGLPMQIMPEEAQLLIEKGAGYILDDARTHDQAVRGENSPRHADYMAQIQRKAEQASNLRAGQMDEKKRKALERRKSKATKSLDESTNDIDVMHENTGDIDRAQKEEADLDLFDSTTSVSRASTTATTKQSYYGSMTPTSSNLFLPTPESTSKPPDKILTLPSSYPLYRHLNSRSYFMTPGLRFGCQYCVYPGDPLRFHSHFLAMGVDWEEEIDLMDVVGGGRLGTGVKKGWLLGGMEPTGDDTVEGQGKMRTFSVEWAAM